MANIRNSIKRFIVKFLTKYFNYKFVRILHNYWADNLNRFKYGDPEFPRIITLEICGHCNRSCSYCPNVVTPQKARLISMEVVYKFAERLKEIRWSGTVDFIFFNEPTLHPRLPEIVKIVKDYAPTCMPRISTNGDLLNYNLVSQLKKSGLYRIYAMRHIPTKEGWRENINTLSKQFPGMFVIMDIEELEQSHGLNDYGGLFKVNKIMPPILDKGKPSCRVHRHIAQFTIDGDWNLCCTDYQKTMQFGNIMNRSILDMWKDPNFIDIRKKLRNGIGVSKACYNCVAISRRKIKNKNIEEILAV